MILYVFIFSSGLCAGWFVCALVSNGIRPAPALPKALDKVWEPVPKQNFCTCDMADPFFCVYCAEKRLHGMGATVAAFIPRREKP